MRLVTEVTVFLTLGKCTVSARDDLKLKDCEGSFAVYSSPCALFSIIVMELRTNHGFARDTNFYMTG